MAIPPYSLPVSTSGGDFFAQKASHDAEVNRFVNDKVNPLEAGLNAESEARQSGDANLQTTKADKTALAAEVLAREDADDLITDEVRQEVEARSALIDTVDVGENGGSTAVGVITTDEGAIAAIVRRDGAFHAPAIRVGGAENEISATEGGGIDLGEIAFESVVGDGDILVMLTDEEGKVGGYLTRDMEWVGPPPESGGDIPASMREQIADNLASIRVNLIGDSITWGRTLPENSDPDPRTGQLTDPRDNLDSPSWANRFRRWLVWAALGVLADIDHSDPGRGEAREPQAVRPYDDARIIREGPWSVQAAVGSPYGSVLSLAPGASMSVRFRGDQLDLIHAVQSSDAGAEASVFVDGVEVSPLEFGGASASLGAVYDLSLGYGDHLVTVVNTSDVDLWLEQIVHHRLVIVQNDGINGRQTANWLPGGTLLNASMSRGYDWVFCQLGTNDRINLLPPTTVANLHSIVRYCQDQGSSVVLLTANACADFAEGGSYVSNMAEISAANARVAEAEQIPHVDQYQRTLGSRLAGITFLADGLHPNAEGHLIMALNLIDAIQRGEI